MTTPTPTDAPVNVLVVDDEGNIRKTLAICLEALARVSRNRHLLLKVQSCRTPDEVLSAVQDWEAQQDVSGVAPAP